MLAATAAIAAAAAAAGSSSGVASSSRSSEAGTNIVHIINVWGQAILPAASSNAFQTLCLECSGVLAMTW